MLCLSQASTWISYVLCPGLFSVCLVSSVRYVNIGENSGFIGWLVGWFMVSFIGGENHQPAAIN
jgi:hypothetical protein